VTARENVAYSPIKLFGQPKMAAILVLGFASGLPLYLTGTGRTLQAWMTMEGVDLTTIGIFSLVALPYSFKWVWAPLLDRYVPPFLGRRRGWLLIMQIAMTLAIGWMAFRNPRAGLQLLAINAVLIAFFSATFDVVNDAYKIDVLSEREMGGGAAMYVLGYRIAMLVTGSLALMLADRMSYQTIYAGMAVLMALTIVATLRAPEPAVRPVPPASLADAVRLPFMEFFGRAGVARGFAVLGFIVLYKLSDYMAQTMATPFLLQTGFSQTEVGAYAGGIGLFATILGVMAGGTLVANLGINRSLWVFGGLQAASNLMYYLLALAGKNTGMLIATMVVENFCTGLVTAGFVAFLMSMCSVRFSATQYALLSSLMSASRDILVSPAGAIAEATGWPKFFLITLIAGIPGLALLPIFAPWNADKPLGAAEHTGETVPAEAA
jgi:PAT family beta-lactamase induction signal transducer AmpG